MIATEWPTNKAADLERFYGHLDLGPDGRASERWESNFLTQIHVPFPLRLAWSPEHTLRSIRCHREVAPSLHRVLGGIVDYFGSQEAVKAANYDLFGGAYEWRMACGSHRLSMHAYGAAIMLGKLRMGKWTATEDDIAVNNIFDAEGWEWLGVSEGWGAISL